jgi:putative flippase GtrA
VTAPTLPVTAPAGAPLSPLLAVPVGWSRRQLPRFVLVGTVTTLAYLAVYAAVQPFVGAQAANLFALLLTADANTVGNRRFSFGLTGRHHALRHRLQGIVAFGVSLVLTSAALGALDAVGSSSTALHLAVLIAANVASGALHFVLLRAWAFAGD